MIFRKYNPEKDKESLYRVIREVDWEKDATEIFHTRWQKLL